MVAPWVETILRLWDDPNYYEQQRQRSLKAAARWSYDCIAEQYDAYFRALLGKA